MASVPPSPSLSRQLVCLMPSYLMGWNVPFLDGVLLRNVRQHLHIRLIEPANDRTINNHVTIETGCFVC